MADEYRTIVPPAPRGREVVKWMERVSEMYVEEGRGLRIHVRHSRVVRTQ